ncbi:shikimate dehydrogenase [Sphingomonas sp. R1]|uniref:shikimate dehydrogenase n=1 Tax=Sphingomonas sp. R1 TaxID=399176 RepID=UPI002223FBAA|nr:shikimate dehydrogenase [Sphingomonas sp. R1]UYY76278.1 shikimate dehydrogenase [Sphingomonas sp. R1]
MIRYAEVIGDPIAHSKSPIIHKFWLDALGIEGDYRTTHVRDEDLAGYFDRARHDAEWRGCNVTIPHKLAVMDLVGDPGGVRSTIGAMNTVIRGEDGTLIGTNTDAGGFFSPIAGLELEGRHAVVVGAGGGARAVLFALARVGIGKVTILNRNVLKGAALLSSFGVKGDALPIGAPLPAADLLVNASPLGMDGQPPLDLNLDPLPEHAVVYDIVYAPLETPLLAQARDRELDTVDGLEMLVGQAALAFELFFGAEPPRDRDEDLRALLTA